MDYARERFGDDFVESVKALLGIIFVFLPLPVFWALFNQQVVDLTNTAVDTCVSLTPLFLAGFALI